MHRTRRPGVAAILTLAVLGVVGAAVPAASAAAPAPAVAPVAANPILGTWQYAAGGSITFERLDSDTYVGTVTAAIRFGDSPCVHPVGQQLLTVSDAAWRWEYQGSYIGYDAACTERTQQARILLDDVDNASTPTVRMDLYVDTYRFAELTRPGRLPWPPGAPGTPTAVAGDGRVALSWSKPGTTGSDPIVDYAVVRTSDGTSWTAPRYTGSALPATVVTGLANGQRYRFRVAAVSVAGLGDWSTPSAWVTPTGASAKPSAPRALRARVTTGGRIVVNWETPLLSKGITGYQWRAGIGTAVTRWQAVPGGAPARWLTVTGARRGTSYVISVRAVAGRVAGDVARTAVRVP